MRLEARGVTHAYGTVLVLEHVSLAVGPGEVVAVAGPSGCGKSTLLRILGGLERPLAGEVILEGEPPPGATVPVAYVFQDFALLPWRTVAGNVALALEGRGLVTGEIAARVAALLARTHLAEFAGAWPRQLSGGMGQRVGLARALAARPAILLLDEPLSALDAQTRELLMDDLAALLDVPTDEGQRLGAVYVTHNLDEAARLADRVLVLSRRPGRVREVVAFDAPRAARTRPEVARRAEELWALVREDALAAERELERG